MFLNPIPDKSLTIVNTTPNESLPREISPDVDRERYLGGVAKFKTACTEIGGRSGRRPDMTFLDFWSTSSALYEADEGLNDVGAAC